MSQAKVDRYKEEKANRKKTLIVNKIKKRVAIVCAWVVLVALVAWAGISGFNYYMSTRPRETYFAKTEALSKYISDLSGTETEESNE